MFVRAGAAIVNYEWLVESVKAGQLVPVDQYPPKRRQDMGQASQQAESRTGHDTHVAGDRKAGPAPLNNGNVNKDKDDENDEDDDDDDGSSADPTGAKRKRNPMPLDLLVRIFAAVPPGGRPNYDELVEKVRSVNAVCNHRNVHLQVARADSFSTLTIPGLHGRRSGPNSSSGHIDSQTSRPILPTFDSRYMGACHKSSTDGHWRRAVQEALLRSIGKAR
jgi:hypothetical protein